MSHAIEIMGAGTENIEERMIRELRRKVGDTVPDAVIVETAHQALNEYRDARIQQFVPILATRTALDALRNRGQSGTPGR